MANIATAASSLWTPGGEVPLQQKDVVPISAEMMQVFVDLHEVAQKLRIQVNCSLCGASFQGANQGTEAHFAVACSCRELRGVSRPKRVKL